MQLEVLYEDNHTIAVRKPAGLLIQMDDTGEESLMDVVKEYIKVTKNKPGEVFLGLVHRLDRNVSGIVVFAKTSKAASRLSEQFREHQVEKVYTALVHGLVPDHAKLKHYLLKNEENNMTSVYDKPYGDAKEATLSFTVLRRRSDTSLVSIILGTGRSHQIRAQMAYIGHPLVGDVKYGSNIKLPDHEISLCATKLAFNHVVTGERIVLETEPRWEV